MPESDTSQSPDVPEADLSFEQAFDRLESVVEEMENGQIPLAGLIENYEAGIRLHRICQKRLEEAQGRIEIIRKRVDGEIEVEAFDPGNAAAEPEISVSTPAKAAKPSLKEDAELF